MPRLHDRNIINNGLNKSIMNKDWLNPALDPDAIRLAYRRRMRFSIPKFLKPELAEHIQAALATRVPWTLCYMEQGKPYGVPLSDWNSWTPERRAEFVRKVNATAGHEFQFLYFHHALSEARARGETFGELLDGFVDFLNSPGFIDFVKYVSGARDGVIVDAHAARYCQGHFLNRHNDYLNTNRRVAYVFNFTPVWRADWGGSLNFLEQDGTVSETVVPVFNTLSLFTVPVMHCVSPVGAFAAGERFSVTGWLYAGSSIEKPNPAT
jgi:SM-20-related protein